MRRVANSGAGISASRNDDGLDFFCLSLLGGKMGAEANVPPFVKAGKKLKKFSRQEVEQHKSEKSLMLIIDTYVWDLTDFVDMHRLYPR